MILSRISTEVLPPTPPYRATTAQASAYGHVEVVARLLAAGASVNAVTALGASALLCASRGGHTSVVLALLNASASVDNEDGTLTPLMAAAMAGAIASRHCSAFTCTLQSSRALPSVPLSGVKTHSVCGAFCSVHIVHTAICGIAEASTTVTTAATSTSTAAMDDCFRPRYSSTCTTVTRAIHLHLAAPHRTT